MLKSKNKYEYIYYSIIITGVLLATIQLLFNRSLWLDEVSIARNLLNTDFLGLLEPLNHGQIAPIGYLFIVKSFGLIFGYGEISLRFYSFLCYLFSIPLLYFVSMRLSSNNKVLSLLATAIFSISMTSIYYASELKQYSGDILISLLILNSFLLYNDKRKNIKYIILFGFIGTVSIWFSNIAVICLFSFGIYILYNQVYKNKNFTFLLILVLWITSFLIYYFNFIYLHPTTEYMQEYWHNNFMSYDVLTVDFYLFWARVFYHTFVLLFSDAFLGIFIFPMILFSIIQLLRKKKYPLLFILLFPIIVHLFLSGFKLYPYALRLILYLSPLLIYLYANGLFEAYKIIKNKSKYWIFLGIIPILVAVYPISKSFPLEKEELKPLLQKLNNEKATDEKLYIYYAANFAFDYYQEINFCKIKDGVIYGSLYRDDMSKYNQELTELLKLETNYYLLFSHEYKYERGYIVNYLLENGATVLSKELTPGCRLYYMKN